jgi:hypothetical protein
MLILFISINEVYASWGKPIRITYNDSISLVGDLAIDKEGRAHILWVDKKEGKWKVYYVRVYNEKIEKNEPS